MKSRFLIILATVALTYCFSGCGTKTPAQNESVPEQIVTETPIPTFTPEPTSTPTPTPTDIVCIRFPFSDGKVIRIPQPEEMKMSFVHGDIFSLGVTFYDEKETASVTYEGSGWTSDELDELADGYEKITVSDLGTFFFMEEEKEEIRELVFLQPIDENVLIITFRLEKDAPYDRDGLIKKYAYDGSGEKVKTERYILSDGKVEVGIERRSDDAYLSEYYTGTADAPHLMFINEEGDLIVFYMFSEFKVGDDENLKNYDYDRLSLKDGTEVYWHIDFFNQTAYTFLQDVGGENYLSISILDFAETRRIADGLIEDWHVQ